MGRGREAPEGYIYKIMTHSCCTAETNTRLLSIYTAIYKKQKQTKKYQVSTLLDFMITFRRLPTVACSKPLPVY